MPRRLGYVPAFDGVRGIAILAVVGVHFFNLPGGAYGVDVFFVLSGFLITTLLLEEHDRDGRISVRRFYARRARRLLPAMVAMVLAVVMVGLALFPAHQVVKVVAAGGLYAANVVRAVAPTVLTGTPLDHMWSLAQEEQFYLVWPIILIALLRRRSARIAESLAAVFIALVVYRIMLVGFGASGHRIYFAPDTHADGLVLGCIAAFLRRRRFAFPSWVGWTALGALVLLLSTRMPAPWPAVAGLPLVELASAGLVLAAASTGGVSRLLSASPLVWAGAISYSLYLWHMPIKWLFRVLEWPHPWIGLPLSVVAALASYRLIEQPFRHRKPAGPDTRILTVEPAPARLLNELIEPRPAGV